MKLIDLKNFAPNSIRIVVVTPALKTPLYGFVVGGAPLPGRDGMRYDVMEESTGNVYPGMNSKFVMSTTDPRAPDQAIGDSVLVFCDPHTRRTVEGVAVLSRIIEQTSSELIAFVTFPDGYRVRRTIGK